MVSVRAVSSAVIGRPWAVRWGCADRRGNQGIHAQPIVRTGHHADLDCRSGQPCCRRSAACGASGWVSSGSSKRRSLSEDQAAVSMTRS